MSNPNQPFTARNLANIKRRFYEKTDEAGLLPDKPHKQQEPTLRRTRMRKAVSIPIVAILSIGVLTGAAAAMNIVDLSAVLHFLDKSRLDILSPVNRSSEDQGIRMDILGAVRDGDTAEIYVALTDLTGHRVTDTLDVYDFSVTGGRANNAQLVHYDETAKKAIVRFLVQGEHLKDRITVKISSFLTGSQTNEDIDVDLNWSALLERQTEDAIVTLDPMKDWISGGSGPQYDEITSQPSIPVLKPDQLHISVPGLAWVYISNVGMVNGKLHIQINPDAEMGTYNHGYFYFVDDQGLEQDILLAGLSYGSYEKDGVQMGGDYEEYIFDIPDIRELQHLHLKGKFTSYDAFVKGSWESTFDLKQSTAKKKAALQHASNQSNSGPLNVEVSELGVTLTGDLSEVDSEHLDLRIVLQDGTTIGADSGFVQLDQDIVKWISTETIPVSHVRELILNGISVPLHD